MLCTICSNQKTVKTLLQIDTVREHHKQMYYNVPCKDVFRDVWDGNCITENSLLKIELLFFGLILYQDALEVC